MMVKASVASYLLVAVVGVSCSRFGHAFTIGSQISGSSIRPTTSPRSHLAASKDSEDDATPFIPTNTVVSKVAVAGATGRTGSLVVQELLNRDVEVVGLVRDMDKASQVFPDTADDALTITQCDLSDADAIGQAIDGCDAVIWCATGFSDAQTSIIERLKRLFGIALVPQQSIDAVGVPAIGKALSSANGDAIYPKIVMLSSAGVTRPAWDDAKKKRFPGSADIPIVRLNPFGILGVKADSEQKLRETGANYAIVRPAGLNDNWPIGSRPIFTQGDIAAGRINRQDVATVLVDVLSTPEACHKTFEVIGVCNYPPARSIRPALSKLQPDGVALSMDHLSATYTIMQQLLPGEAQQSAQLAMGQTYEQLDKDEVGRLGKRGEENIESAVPQPTTVAGRESS